MRRLLLAAALLITASASSAFDGVEVAEKYYDLRAACRQGDDFFGNKLTAEERQNPCDRLDPIWKDLRENGYCWDRGEVVWYVCEPLAS